MNPSGSTLDPKPESASKKLPPIFDDSQTYPDKILELFKKHDSAGKGSLGMRDATAVFADALGQAITLDEFDVAFRAFDRDVFSNLDDQWDYVDILRWFRVIFNSQECKDVLVNEGAAAALKRSSEIATKGEKARLTASIRNMSPIKALIRPQIPKVFGDVLNEDADANFDEDFTPAFSPLQMRSLALVSHNNMKGTMRAFVEANKNLLSKFRLTGTNSTMTMLKEVFGANPSVVYGRSCKSGPLGGDAQLVAAMCNGELGGMFFFQDPMESHMHSADIECLNRQALIYNVMTAVNPTSAIMLTHTLREALKQGKAELIPSFIFTLECPTVQMYADRQKAVIQANIDNGQPIEVSAQQGGAKEPQCGCTVQ